MFIISLTYITPIGEVDKHLQAHVEYLKEQYKLGYFIASGRKNPRTGGIILSNLNDRSMLENVLNKDPFKRNGIANYDIIEFEPTMASEELKFLIKE